MSTKEFGQLAKMAKTAKSLREARFGKACQGTSRHKESQQSFNPYKPHLDTVRRLRLGSFLASLAFPFDHGQAATNHSVEGPYLSLWMEVDVQSRSEERTTELMRSLEYDRSNHQA